MKKNLKNLLLLSSLLAITGCGNTTGNSSASAPTSTPSNAESSTAAAESSTVAESSTAAQFVVDYARGNDEAVYDAVLGDFATFAEVAKGIVDDDARYVKYAEAEAALLDSATFIPTTTQGGAYTVSRVAPKTIPYVLFGNDTDRLKKMVVVEEPAGSTKTFIKASERDELNALWQAAREGGAAYDPAAYLTAKGYTLAKAYKTTFSTAPATLDIVNTSEAADTEILVNCVEGLVEYDNLGNLKGQLAVEQADGRPFALSEDGKTYTFKIREDAKWYTNEGQVYADVTADDFVAGFQHMLDAQAGLDFLVDGVVVGVSEYLREGGSFDNVGVKAVDAHTLQFTLVAAESFFPTRLVYSCFMPINRQKFLAQGGAFGLEEFAEAQQQDSYGFAVTNNLNSNVYNGPFVPVAFDSNSQIKLVKNANYHDAAKVTLDSITWIYDDGSNPDALYNSAMDGTYAGIGLGKTTGLLDRAKAEPNDFFSTYSYVSDTNATTYFAGLNVNRQAKSVSSGGCATTKSDAEIEYAWYAMQNKNFRKAIAAAWDRKTWNAISRGEELGATNLRNMYTAPTFVSVSKDVTADDGHVFKQGTTYGDMVQYFLDKRGNYINVADGQDGYFNPAKAQEFMAAAKAEIGEKWTGPVVLEVVYYQNSQTQVAQAESFKALIEANLGTENVQVKLIAATTTADYYAAGYRCPDGKSLPQDVFYGSGWGPDYADPSSYLDTMKAGGYMTKVLGLF